MAVTERRETERWSKSHKSGPSSDRGLQLDLLKLELLVIAGQLYCGEYVLESCTRVAVRFYKQVRLNRIGANAMLRSEISDPEPRGSD